MSGMTMCCLAKGCMLAQALEIGAKEQLQRDPTTAHGWKLKVRMQTGPEWKFGIQNTFNLDARFGHHTSEFAQSEKWCQKYTLSNRHPGQTHNIKIDTNIFA